MEDTCMNRESERDPMQVNIEQVCREWKARGFSCDIWSDPPGQIWANFIHATDELVMLLEGEFELHLP